MPSDGSHSSNWDGQCQPDLVLLPQVASWGLPERLLRPAGDIREFEPASFIASFARGSSTILNVGPSWGRDFYGLRTQGQRVFNLDIAAQVRLPHSVLGDVTRTLPFADGTFDAIIAAEVLEHLIEDHLALAELRRVLADDGHLIVTVPLYQDIPRYHVRVHSPRSITRLLAATGFDTELVMYRSGFISHPKLVHGVRKLLAPFGFARRWYAFAVAVDYWWGARPVAARHARGCYVVASKSKTAFDWRALNRMTYDNR
ncbi:MAG: class I SAM-dependent methyltransferase [Anaerolineae bacterium]|nr:class I SAM-dependent methyltransferase [Anaerolineae bacterium]